MIPNSSLFSWTLNAAEKVTGVYADYITQERRTARVCRARIAVFYFLHSSGWPTQRIADFFSGMNGKTIDVSTVVYGIKRAKKLRDEDWSFLYLCDQIKNIVDETMKSVRTVSIGLHHTR